ncbi:hypothetical protein N7481_001627 [Penicillium waksmanii]|uniref:uncharacterized protein n=1 Tax=Penicillium waksmanii TaxID=69791 RepID=UPI002546F2CC|nr:uncharacterized protein N7481_001627 [Penicillium waksmanii]KAJ6001218.1 hypothetical protein N7481_001627 [Penicillium waksmanii]
MSQSQDSQFSDNYSSSIFEDNPLDNLTFLSSDGLQPFNPDTLYGQSTPDSTPNLGFARPALPPSIPETLEHVGPQKKKIYVLWTDMVNDEFVAWWLKTEYGSQTKRNIFESRLLGAFSPGSCYSGWIPAKVMCRTCDHILSHPADRHRGTSSMNKHYSQGVNCRKLAPRSQDIRRLIRNGAKPSQKGTFTQQAWIERVITFMTASRLPFQLVEHPQFRALIEMARLAPSFPEIPSAYMVRRQLQELVQERQNTLLRTLPMDAKLSIALDCWTSPFWQAFMAVTAYFLDKDWNYREILLGFEPLHGAHTGLYLSTVLLELLQKHRIEDRVLTATTDNASNNSTLVDSIRGTLQSLELPNHKPIIRMPCIAHVIQLSLKELLGRMEANPRNEREEMEWTKRDNGARRENREIVHTLSKSVLNDFCSQYDNQELRPSQDEWRQIDYLLSITQPFFTFTTSLSKTKEITIHSVFAIYNTLFSHLEKSRAQLARKMVDWKKVMLSAIHAARLKLSEYYKLINGIDSDLYAIGTILAPQNKLEFFSGKDWEPHWRVRYRKSLENYLVPYQQRYSETQSISSSQSLIGGISDVDILVTSTTSLRPQTNAHDELSRYLGSTRDVLTTPASGSGVERLFNSARDICHYRRGSLKSKTIQDLMLFMCTTKFDMESEQLSLMDDYFTTQEAQAAREEKDARKAECEFDLISDSEDEPSAAISQTVQTVSEHAHGKRRRAENITEGLEHVIELDEEDEVPLPDNIHIQGESSTQRRSSGRLPKRSR